MTWINVWTQRGTEFRPAGKRAASVGGEKLAAYAAAGQSNTKYRPRSLPIRVIAAGANPSL